MRITTIKIFLIGLLVAGLIACRGEETGEESARQAFLDTRAAALNAFKPCRREGTTPQASLVAESLCLNFSVPEDPDDPDGRHIFIKVMVIPSLSDLPEPDPLVLMAGGPGQAATDLTQVAQVFSRTRTERDILLVDQRGTGELSPFDCQMDEEQVRELDEQNLSSDEVLARQLQMMRDCLAATDAHPEFYTTDIAMQDLDAVREFLGYTQFNLWGASYGSRAALAYLQAFPGNSRSVIIDAIAPPALSLPLYVARDASASLEKLLADCAADSACHTAFPDLKAHYRALLDRLATPQQVTVTRDVDFKQYETSLDENEFLSFLRQVLYSREAQRLIPLIIEQAWQGNFKPVFALAGQYSETGINQGMFLSVICNEDATRFSDDELAAEANRDYLIHSPMFNSFIRQACGFWPKREVPASYFEPVTAGKPVLIFSGALDPVTPPSWGERVHASLPQSEHLVIEGFGHGTVFTRCTADIMNDFIDTGSLEGLDTRCISRFKRRPFFVTPGGSTLADD